MDKIFAFPRGFLWGSATSAYQVEGGIENADWSLVHAAGRAADQYHRYKEDFDWAKKLNQNAHRLSLEWSRIEPAQGVFDQKEIEHYRRVLLGLKQRGLKTVLTLWHWTIPLWLAEKGGWTNSKAVDYFSRYTSVITKELGELVDLWVTLNEPMNHVLLGYGTGAFPPQKKNLFFALKALHNLIEAHKASYLVIHKHYPKAQVSISKAMSYFEPARAWLPLERSLARAADWLWNDYFLFRIKDELDYVGFSYYFHGRIIWRPPFFKMNFHQRTTDIGWEICPEGMYYVLLHLERLQKPIYILENGLADAKDRYRTEFIKSHLYWTWKAITEGVDVRGYFHWSLIDNFEWGRDGGFSPRFGLIEIDYGTMERKPRQSAFAYAAICEKNQLAFEPSSLKVCIQYAIY